MNEDILKNALEQALDESYNELIDQDIPDYDFSPEFKKKMDGLILSQQAQPEKKRSKMLWFMAMTAAAALLAVTIGVTKAARPSRTHDLPSDIISKTTDTDTSAVTGAKGTTGTSSAAVTETYTTAAVTQSSKGVSEKTTSTKTNVVTTKQTTVRSSSASITQTAATAASSTATVASVSVSVTDITTGTFIELPVVERRFSMKKISTFLAALIAANQTPALITNADDVKIEGSSPYIYSYNYDEDDLFGYIPELHQRESDLDFNKDGKFDINDIYAFYLYWNDIDFEEPENFDFSAIRTESGIARSSLYTFDQIVKYFATYYTIIKEHIDTEKFNEFIMNNVSKEFINNHERDCEGLYNGFIIEFVRSADKVFQFYDMFKEITNRNDVDLDINGDRKFNFDDVYIQTIFDNSFHNYGFFTDNIEDSLNNCDASIRDILSADIIERCINLMNIYKYEDFYPMRANTHLYMLQYYLENHPYDPAWNDIDFYDSVYPEYEEKRSTSMMLIPDIDALQYNLGYGSNTMRYYYTRTLKADMETEYNNFIEQVESGKRTIPDINGDGKLDMQDYCLSNLFFDDYRYIKDIPFPEEYRQTFLAEMDLNDNGMIADVNDVAIYQICIGNELGYTSYQLNSAERQYYAEHPEFNPDSSGKYTSYYYVYDQETSFTNYVNQIKEGTNKAPDIDKDGKITIADYAYAYIVQNAKSSGNDYRMSIVPEEVKDYYLNDCDFDQDGYSATYGDLELIKRYVGSELGLDYDADYGKFNDDLINLQERFLSQFNDQLPEYEKTLRAKFNPELTDNFTFVQLDLIYSNTKGMEYIYDHEKEIKNNITDEQKKILDTNLNGTIELEDRIIAKSLYNNYFTDDNSNDKYIYLMTPKRMENFYNNFDLDGNGMNGDLADITWADMLYYEILGIENMDSSYQEEAIKNLSSMRPEWTGLSCDDKQTLRHEYVKQYRKDIESGKMPAPDLNEDGKVDIADYVAASPATYSRSAALHESEIITMGHLLTNAQVNRFFEVYDLDKDGVCGSLEDLNIMEMYIKEELGYNSLEIGAYVNEFCEQYKEYVNSYFDKSQFKEDLTKDMSLLEKYSIIYTEEELSYYRNAPKELKYDTIKTFDLNMNGILEPEDYAIAEYLHENYYTDNFEYPDDSSLITDKIRDNFYKNFDPDGNGVCGSRGDLELMENYLEYFTDNSGFIYRYRNGSATDSGVPLEKIRETLASGKTIVNTAESEERSGDANADSTVDLADAVAILQAYVNPDKYALSEEGSYNADIYNTGDGVTPKDAQKIQMILLNIK